MSAKEVVISGITFVIKKIYLFFTKLFLSLKLVVFKRKMLHTESYYPEYSNNTKRPLKQTLEMLQDIWRDGGVNKFYYLYGFDIKNLYNRNDFVLNREFIVTRNRLNNNGVNSPVSILRDKTLFGLFLKALNVPSPENIGVVENGMVYCADKQSSLDAFLSQYEGDVFFKIVDGECGADILHVIIEKGQIHYGGRIVPIDEFKAILGKGRFLVQKTLKQHDAINRIFSKSINTIRIVTVHNRQTNEIEVISAVLRVGTGNNNVDNWAAGGLSIGINLDKGTLHKFGFYKPGYGTKVESHPDSNVVFDGYQLPFFDDVVGIVKRLHFYLKNVHSIGWDVAITPQGACVIEGNDNWEISLMQACDHGLKKEFDSLFR